MADLYIATKRAIKNLLEKEFNKPNINVQLAGANKNGETMWYATYIKLTLDFGTLGCIKNPPVEVQLATVFNYSDTIEIIETPSLEAQLEDVRKNPSAIGLIKTPSLKVQMEAVKQNPSAIEYINKPSKEVCSYILSLKNYELNEILLEKLFKQIK